MSILLSKKFGQKINYRKLNSHLLCMSGAAKRHSSMSIGCLIHIPIIWATKNLKFIGPFGPYFML